MGDRRWSEDEDHKDVQKDIGSTDFSEAQEVSFDDPIPPEPEQPQDLDDE